MTIRKRKYKIYKIENNKIYRCILCKKICPIIRIVINPNGERRCACFLCSGLCKQYKLILL